MLKENDVSLTSKTSASELVVYERSGPVQGEARSAHAKSDHTGTIEGFDL